ncbi:GIY-YIG nuclease family protein [Brevundimonas sp.]|uniref:GIY-YIG nuclease family protein n=1 Tax=Brevundimonas sp. TaxID=1871086 RepID=UPI00351CE7E8
MFCSNNDWLARELSVRQLDSNPLPAGYFPLYIGSASNLQRRVRSHVGRSSVASSMRGSLGTILAEQIGLTPLASDVGADMWFAEEAVLSEWIDQHCVVGVREAANPLQLEKALVVTQRPPLNISFLKTTPLARCLIGARARVRAEARRLRVEQRASSIICEVAREPAQ